MREKKLRDLVFTDQKKYLHKETKIIFKSWIDKMFKRGYGRLVVFEKNETSNTSAVQVHLGFASRIFSARKIKTDYYVAKTEYYSRSELEVPEGCFVCDGYEAITTSFVLFGLCYYRTELNQTLSVLEKLK
jgi:hypothetical protein